MKDDDPDERTLRRYLLGELPEAEEDELERRLLEDDELFERCEALEADLLDEFEEGRLESGPTKRVEAWLDASPEMRLRHQVIRNLRAVLPPEAGGQELESAGGGTVLPMPIRPRASSWLPWVALAAALLLAAGWFWFWNRQNVAPKPEMAHETPAPTSKPGTVAPPQASNLPPERQAQKPAPQEKPKDLDNELKSLGYISTTVAATILEIPLEVRRDVESELPTYSLKKGAKDCTFRFLFDFPPGTDRFDLRLLNAQGGEVGAWSHLKVRTVKGEPALVVTLPAEKVPPGRYGVQADPIEPGPDDVPVEIRFVIAGGEK